MIDQLTIGRIMDAVQVVDVVSQFVTLKRRGVNYVGLCPFHTDKTPSFYVSPSKNICKCFACGEGGTAVHFIMKHEQLSYVEALKYLAKKYNIEVQERELTDDQKKAHNERESLFIANEYARNYFLDTLHKHLEGKSIGLSYFKERGFRDDIVRKFQLGYSLEERDAFTLAAIKAGYKQDILVKTGLTIEGDNNYIADRFRGRVLFPVHTLSGKVVAFGGRTLKKGDKIAKYINSPESAIYHKGNELYGIYFAKQAITKTDCCYLVEGYTDVLSMHQAGIENVVSSSGTALTYGQIRLIHRFTSNVTLIYDGDAAGIKAALRGIDLLLEEGMNIKVLLLPDGEDPDSFARKQNAESLTKYIKANEVDFIRFKTRLLLDEAGEDPIKRAHLITDIVASIAVIPDTIIRTVYIRDCGILLEIDERILVQEVDKKRLTHTVKSLSHTTSSHPLVAQAAPDVPPPPPEEEMPLTNSISVEALFADNKQNPLYKIELSILYFIIRHGMEKLVEYVDDAYETPEEKAQRESTAYTVIDYVKFDLERDYLGFSHPLYRLMLEEAIQHRHEEGFVPSRYFLANQNQTVSRIAAELLGDRYQLSKVHTKQYGEDAKAEDTPLAEEHNLIKTVPRVLTELKYEYISQQLASVNAQMQQKQAEGDMEAAIALIARKQELGSIKRMLAKVLGERIILGL